NTPRTFIPLRPNFGGVTPKVLAPGRYPIDVEPILPRLKKNRGLYLHYIERLKENVRTLREIVEDANVERPLDTSLASACHYTKHSQELLEYVIGTCPKDFVPRNKQNASTNSLRKKGVTVVKPHETTTHNTPPQVEHQKINSTNIAGIPSIGVKGVVRSEMVVKQSPATKVWNTPPKVLPTKQWKPTGRLLLLGRQCPLVRSTALKSDYMPADPQETIAPVASNLACTNQLDPNFQESMSKLFAALTYQLRAQNPILLLQATLVYLLTKRKPELLLPTYVKSSQTPLPVPSVSNPIDQEVPSGISIPHHLSVSFNPYMYIKGFAVSNLVEVIPFAAARCLKPFVNVFALDLYSDAYLLGPLDSSLALLACRYTKQLTELLECDNSAVVLKTLALCDKQNALYTSLGTSGRVKGASAASRSKPRSNTKKDRTLPAKSALKQVEAHSRMNKSNEKHKNRVDSSISYKRTVINSNSNTSCKTCNKCLISVNHDQCVVRSEMCVKQSSATKVWRVKQVKQVWKATGKLFTTIGHQWRPTGRLLPLGDQWPLTRNTPPKVLPTKQWKPTGRLLPLGRQCPLVRSTALKSDCLPADPQETIAPVVQIVLWYLDSGCSKHMTGDRSRLRNFVKKFIGTVRFGNDHFGAIMGYGDYVIGDSVISRVYYVEGLGHNLFSVGQFCDSDLEVAFRKHTCFVRDLDGVDLIKGSRGTNLYTISVEDMMRSSPICLLSKASKNKSWLWHRRLNHLNFGTLNDLARKDLVRGLPRLKFEKDHLCSACQLGKSRKATHKPKTINTITEVLHTLHMDLCGPLRVQSINGKKYILVIVDDYSRFTWVKFLRSKDETPAFVTNLLKQLQVGLNKTVWFVRTDNGTEFVNKDLTDFYESVGITHEKTVLRTPQQNGVVEQRNRTLVEAARTMLIFSKAPLFLWAEAVAATCYTQNRSLIHTLHNKTP
ncbi:retrovirus-related pol polyprotein from transposon TNT 1-94, partial [Tanacetum coccineum]